MTTTPQALPEPELLPCPFCGHDTPEFERLGDRGQSCIVVCGNCGCRHESSDEGERNGQSWNGRAAIAAQQPAEAAWRPIETAPKDGTLLWLLVEFEDHATEDTNEPCPTIGANSLADTGDDEWKFAGWCWTHDHFTEGVGKPVAWMPIAAATQPAAPEPKADEDRFHCRDCGHSWNAVDTSERPRDECPNCGAAAPAGNHPAETIKLTQALAHAQAWISTAPHGDNCFVSDHYEGDPGNQCNCGKDGALDAIEAALLDAECAAPAEAQAETQRCPNCDDTGDAHSIDGQWRGICHCPAGQALRASQPPQAVPVAWAVFDSRGYYCARQEEQSAVEFCKTYNARKNDPLQPYTYKPLYLAPQPPQPATLGPTLHCPWCENAFVPIGAPTPQAVPVAQAASEQDERVAFEAKFREPMALYGDMNGNTMRAMVHSARWEGWQARAALSAPGAPPAQAVEPSKESLAEICKALYGNSTLVTTNTVTAKAYMADPDWGWLCIRFNTWDHAHEAHRALSLLARAAEPKPLVGAGEDANG